MVRPYQQNDLEEINSWFQAHNVPKIPVSAIPKVGFVVPYVAAAFLYQTDGNFALIENLVTNPLKEATIRHEAIDMVVDAITNKAKDLGFHQLVFLTNEKQVMRRGERHDFDYVDKYHMMKKEL